MTSGGIQLKQILRQPHLPDAASKEHLAGRRPRDFYGPPARAAGLHTRPDAHPFPQGVGSSGPCSLPVKRIHHGRDNVCR